MIKIIDVYKKNEDIFIFDVEINDEFKSIQADYFELDVNFIQDLVKEEYNIVSITPVKHSSLIKITLEIKENGVILYFTKDITNFVLKRL